MQAYVQEPLLAAVTCWVLVTGLLIANGVIKKTLAEFFYDCAVVFCFTAIGLSVFNYTHWVIEFGGTLDQWIMSPLPGNAQTVWEALDNLWVKAIDLVKRMMKLSVDFDIRNPGGSIFDALMLWLLVIVVAVGVFFLTNMGVMLVVANKIVLTIMLGLGPLFIALAVFRYTRSFFEGWLKTCLTAIFTFVLLAAALSFVGNITDPIVDAMEKLISGDGDTSKIMEGMMPNMLELSLIFLILCLSVTWLFRWIPLVVHNLTGGLAGAGGPGLISAAGQTFSTAARTASAGLQAGKGAAAAAGGVAAGAASLAGMASAAQVARYAQRAVANANFDNAGGTEAASKVNTFLGGTEDRPIGGLSGEGGVDSGSVSTKNIGTEGGTATAPGAADSLGSDSESTGGTKTFAPGSHPSKDTTAGLTGAHTVGAASTVDSSKSTGAFTLGAKAKLDSSGSTGTMTIGGSSSIVTGGSTGAAFNASAGTAAAAGSAGSFGSLGSTTSGGSAVFVSSGGSSNSDVSSIVSSVTGGPSAVSTTGTAGTATLSAGQKGGHGAPSGKAVSSLNMQGGSTSFSSLSSLNAPSSFSVDSRTNSSVAQGGATAVQTLNASDMSNTFVTTSDGSSSGLSSGGIRIDPNDSSSRYVNNSSVASSSLAGSEFSTNLNGRPINEDAIRNATSKTPGPTDDKVTEEGGTERPPADYTRPSYSALRSQYGTVLGTYESVMEHQADAVKRIKDVAAAAPGVMAHAVSSAQSAFAQRFPQGAAVLQRSIDQAKAFREHRAAMTPAKEAKAAASKAKDSANVFERAAVSIERATGVRPTVFTGRSKASSSGSDKTGNAFMTGVAMGTETTSDGDFES